MRIALCEVAGPLMQSAPYNFEGLMAHSLTIASQYIYYIDDIIQLYIYIRYLHMQYIRYTYMLFNIHHIRYLCALYVMYMM